jgi:hypothetical protein
MTVVLIIVHNSLEPQAMTDRAAGRNEKISVSDPPVGTGAEVPSPLSFRSVESIIWSLASVDANWCEVRFDHVYHNVLPECWRPCAGLTSSNTIVGTWNDLTKSVPTVG